MDFSLEKGKGVLISRELLAEKRDWLRNIILKSWEEDFETNENVFQAIVRILSNQLSSISLESNLTFLYLQGSYTTLLELEANTNILT